MTNFRMESYNIGTESLDIYYLLKYLDKEDELLARENNHSENGFGLFEYCI